MCVCLIGPIMVSSLNLVNTRCSMLTSMILIATRSLIHAIRWLFEDVRKANVQCNRSGRLYLENVREFRRRRDIVRSEHKISTSTSQWCVHSLEQAATKNHQKWRLLTEYEHSRCDELFQMIGELVLLVQRFLRL